MISAKELQKFDIYVSNSYIKNLNYTYNFTNFESFLEYVKTDLHRNHLHIYHNLKYIINLLNYDLVNLIKDRFDSAVELFVYTAIVRLLNSKTLYFNTKLRNLVRYIDLIESEIYILIHSYYNNIYFKSDLFRRYNFYLLKQI